MDMNQKVKVVVGFIIGLVTGIIFMYSTQEKPQTRMCNEPCPDCVPRVPLINIDTILEEQ